MKNLQEKINTMSSESKKSEYTREELAYVGDRLKLVDTVDASVNSWINPKGFLYSYSEKTDKMEINIYILKIMRQHMIIM